MPPLVSIIIPCHNAARWLRATLDCAFAQTWGNREIILIDDGSVDESPAIARTFEARGLRLITQPNAGAAAARNTGLRAASGRFIQFLDADDLLAPDKIEKQMTELALAAPGTIASGPWGQFSDDCTTAKFSPEPVWRDFAPLDWLAASWSGGGMFPPIVWLTPREVIARAGFWDETLTLDDDGEYFCRALLQAAGIRFVDTARSYYRQHGGPRISGARGRRAAESSFRSNEQKERHVRAAKDSPRLRLAVAYNWQRFAWEQMAAAPDLAARALERAQALATNLPPPNGPRMYRIAARLLGWPRARRLQLAALRLLRR